MRRTFFSSAAAVALLLLNLWALSSAGAHSGGSAQRVALPGKKWAVLLDLPDFQKEIDGVKPDGRRYFFASNPKTGVNVSVTLEEVTQPATPQGCRDFLKSVVNGQGARDVKFWSSGDMALAAYTRPGSGGIDLHQRFFRACMAHEDVYVDMNLSKVDFMAGEESLFTEILRTVRFE